MWPCYLQVILIILKNIDDDDMRVSADGAFVQVDTDDHSILFFRSLLSSEAFVRSRVLGAIIQALNASLEGDCQLIKVRLQKIFSIRRLQVLKYKFISIAKTTRN